VAGFSIVDTHFGSRNSPELLAVARIEFYIIGIVINAFI
jgi:hypothetical protein